MIAQFDDIGLLALYGQTTGSVLWAIMVAFTVIGSGWTLFAIVPLLAVPRARRPTIALIATLLVTAVVVFALKHIVERVRPCCVPGGLHALWGGPTDPSFPSGHAAGGFSCAAFVVSFIVRSRTQGLGRIAALMLVPAAILIAVSRVYLGVHYPSDVIVAAAVGSIVGITGALFVVDRAPRPRGSRVSP